MFVFISFCRVGGLGGIVHVYMFLLLFVGFIDYKEYYIHFYFYICICRIR